ncbi:hypothetical protein RvY_19168 [Ramazzottius varieornatus]|uniref:Uncharacterized protein n=1 Tax=Ramazzottius varieornatus TaxID=947166 RepID=A0A1D1W8K5_RAMVA|nr:hypothetical protein RvY_19168 [Ramazzottius varieornatus]
MADLTKVKDLTAILAGRLVWIGGHLQSSRAEGKHTRYTVQALVPVGDQVSKQTVHFAAGIADFTASAIHQTGKALIKGLTGLTRQTGTGRKRSARRLKKVKAVEVTIKKHKRKSVAKKKPRALPKKKKRSSEKKTTRAAKKKTAKGVPLAKLIQHSSRSNPFAA